MQPLGDVACERWLGDFHSEGECTSKHLPPSRRLVPPRPSSWSTSPPPAMTELLPFSDNPRDTFSRPAQAESGKEAAFASNLTPEQRPAIGLHTDHTSALKVVCLTLDLPDCKFQNKLEQRSALKASNPYLGGEKKSHKSVFWWFSQRHQLISLGCVGAN